MDPSLPVCSVCGTRPAVVLRELSGLKVCKKCFIKEIEGKVRKTIARNRMVDVTDKLAIALSGGKDSVALLRLLFSNYEPLLAEHFRRGNAPIAITIDEGIAGYRDESVDIARKLCEQFGVHHVIFSFNAEFGATLDEMVTIATSDRFLSFTKENAHGNHMKNAELLLAKPCSICGVLRRRVLNDIAAGFSATKLVTGHVMNDEMETFLLNLFKGDIARMGRASSTLVDESPPTFIRKIKPLEDIMQQDVVLYLYHAGGVFQESPCPYSRSDTIFRGEMQHLLNHIEMRHPGSLYNVKRFTDVVYPLLSCSKDAGSVYECPACNAPKSKHLETCMPCFYTRALVDKEYTGVLGNFLNRVKNEVKQ